VEQKYDLIALMSVAPVRIMDEAPMRPVQIRPEAKTALTVTDLGVVLGYTVLNAILPRKDEAKQPPSVAFGGHSSRQEPTLVQMSRAAEPGRGRGATTPREIPWRGWSDVLWRTYEQVQEDRIMSIAAGVVFYALLALFPAITALVSLYGLFAQSSTIQEHLAFLTTMWPGAALTIIDEQIARVVSKGNTQLGFGFLIGLGIALWSANAGMKALIDALNIVYEEEEKRGFFKLNLVTLAFTVGAILSLLFAIAAVVALPLLLERLGLGGFTNLLVEYGRWPILMLGLIVGLAVLYRYGPSRKEPKWKWVSIGSLLASALWIAGSAALSLYLEKYAHYDATYGTLGTGIGLMVWMWMTTIVILLGAELNSEMEHQTAADTTEGRPKPLGARGATMADTVGEAQS
jgi:membrane protein